MQTGHELISQLVEATGLPQSLVKDQLHVLIQKAGKKAEEITLDELRPIMAEFLQDVLLSTKEGLVENSNAELAYI